MRLTNKPYLKTTCK